MRPSFHFLYALTATSGYISPTGASRHPLQARQNRSSVPSTIGASAAPSRATETNDVSSKATSAVSRQSETAAATSMGGSIAPGGTTSLSTIIQASITSAVSVETSASVYADTSPLATATTTAGNISPPFDHRSGTEKVAAVSKSTPVPLPISPKITPAIGITGVILLVTGIVYAVIGIKNRWFVKRDGNIACQRLTCHQDVHFLLGRLFVKLGGDCGWPL